MLDLSSLSLPHLSPQASLLGSPPKYRGLYFLKIMTVLFLPFQFVYFSYLHTLVRTSRDILMGVPRVNILLMFLNLM